MQSCLNFRIVLRVEARGDGEVVDDDTDAHVDRVDVHVDISLGHAPPCLGGSSRSRFMSMSMV